MSDNANRKLADEIVAAIVDDLTDRRGLKHEWYQIDDDIKEEILTTWRQIVIERLPRPSS